MSWYLYRDEDELSLDLSYKISGPFLIKHGDDFGALTGSLLFKIQKDFAEIRDYMRGLNEKEKERRAQRSGAGEEAANYNLIFRNIPNKRKKKIETEIEKLFKKVK